MLGLARSEKGWRIFTVRDLEATGAKTRVYLDPDKSRKSKRRELIGRRLCKAIRDEMGPKSVFHQKESGILAMHFVPIARVTIIDEVDYKIEWNTLACSEKHIATEKFTDIVKNSLGTPEHSVVWG